MTLAVLAFPLISYLKVTYSRYLRLTTSSQFNLLLHNYIHTKKAHRCWLS